MNFIVEHAGIFICLAFIVLLAIIGYYADKKDNEDKNREKVSNENDNNVANGVEEKSSNDVSSSILFSELPDVSINQASSNNDQVVDSFETVSNDEHVEINDNSMFGINNFENLNMSLEDLEKKNYESFVSKDSDDGNFYYSDIDDSKDFDINQNRIGSLSDDSTIVDNVNDNDVNDNNVNDNNIVDEKNYIESLNIDNVGQSVNDNSIFDEGVDIQDSGHEFDNEVADENTSINSISDNEIPEIGNNNLYSGEIPEIDNNNSYSGEIPEISDINSDGVVDFNGDGASFNSDLTNDDIWKF